MNVTAHYFGAYLEIKVRQISMTTFKRVCESASHPEARHYEGDFCPICGDKVINAAIVKTRYPIHIVGDIFDYDEWDEDLLAEITPPSIWGSGTIIAIANTKKGGRWLYVDNDWGHKDEQTKPFPTADEIAEMKREFDANHGDIIAALMAHELVESVEIKAGYVLDAEF